MVFLYGTGCQWLGIFFCGKLRAQTLKILNLAAAGRGARHPYDVAANMGVIVEVRASTIGVIEETNATVRTDLDRIPYTPVPTYQPNFFKRFFTGVFHS